MIPERARHHRAVYTENEEGWRYECSCDHVGTERYKTDGGGGIPDAVRKAFHLHAEYADREKQGPTSGSGRHVVRINGKDAAILDEVRVVPVRAPFSAAKGWVVELNPGDDSGVQWSGEYGYEGAAERNAWSIAFLRAAKLGRSQLVVTKTGAFVVSEGEYPQPGRRPL